MSATIDSAMRARKSRHNYQPEKQWPDTVLQLANWPSTSSLWEPFGKFKLRCHGVRFPDRPTLEKCAKGICLCNFLRSTQPNERETMIEGFLLMWHPLTAHRIWLLGSNSPLGSVLLGSSWLHAMSLDRPPADGNVLPVVGAPPKGWWRKFLRFAFDYNF